MLEGVTHRYFREKENGVFRLGPVNFAFHPGEIVYLIGGNGSGKTTLAKLLVGLYVPDEGRVLLDGKPVDRNHAGSPTGNGSPSCSATSTCSIRCSA